MSVLYFETFEKPAAGIAGTERLHLLQLVKEQGLGLGAIADPLYALFSKPAANTCLQAGPDALRLAVRLAAQAEIFCWVDTPNLNWLAWLIGEGLEAGYFRENKGWEAAQAFLLRSTAPVFVSTSITGRMPSRELALKTEMVVGEEYDALPEQEQWGLVELYLRYESALEDKAKESETFTAPFSRELRPENWAEYFFAP